jgi:hypothetical protein
MTLTCIVGLRWASTLILFMEQEMIVEGEQIQSASKNFPTLVNHFFSMAFMIDVSFGGSGGKGGTIALGGRFSQRNCRLKVMDRKELLP